MTRRTRWHLAFFAVLLTCIWFLVLNAIEEQINPVGWDLGTLQKIHELEQLTSQRADP